MESLRPIKTMSGQSYPILEAEEVFSPLALCHQLGPKDHIYGSGDLSQMRQLSLREALVR